jgi:hypothetical protein
LPDGCSCSRARKLMSGLLNGWLEQDHSVDL